MITGTYPYLSALAKNHVCEEHPEEPLVVVLRPEGNYALACTGVHWITEDQLERRTEMTLEDQDTGQPNLIPNEEQVSSLDEKWEILSDSEEEPPEMPLANWYLRFRQFYPQGRVAARPLNPQERSETNIPSDVHAWVAEAYQRLGEGIISIGHGYAREGEEKEEGAPNSGPPWAWQRAEERAEIAAISRAVPLGLEPPERE